MKKDNITPEQIAFIEVKCKLLNIDIYKFINDKTIHDFKSFTSSFKDIKEIPYSLACKMIFVLSEYIRTGNDIPDRIKNS
ncbi:MAG: hypothetical protein SNJ64_01590 [Endomicrobiia bacterium]